MLTQINITLKFKNKPTDTSLLGKKKQEKLSEFL
jgi:hypothetical protein